jgi:hypothetical protein
MDKREVHSHGVGHSFHLHGGTNRWSGAARVGRELPPSRWRPGASITHASAEGEDRPPEMTRNERRISPLSGSVKLAPVSIQTTCELYTDTSLLSKFFRAESSGYLQGGVQGYASPCHF